MFRKTHFTRITAGLSAENSCVLKQCRNTILNVQLKLPDLWVYIPKHHKSDHKSDIAAANSLSFIARAERVFMFQHDPPTMSTWMFVTGQHSALLSDLMFNFKSACVVLLCFFPHRVHAGLKAAEHHMHWSFLTAATL